MKASVIPRYLLGSREAILDIAAAPQAILCGVLLTVSAGLAREYDGEDLFHEPWHLLRPLLVSFIAASILFVVIDGSCRRRRHVAEGRLPRRRMAYRALLSLFWMTAPLASLYAVPYERFLPPLTAVAFNLWTLGLVAAWRVILMARVVSVLYGITGGAAFFLVMVFADLVAVVAMGFVPTHMIGLMGGVRLVTPDTVVANVAISVTILAVVSLPIWLIGWVVSIVNLQPQWALADGPTGPSQGRGALSFAVASIVAFVPLLAIAQPEQMHRRSVEQLIEQDRFADALARMSALAPDDFPPHWVPGPPVFGGRNRQLERFCQAMEERWPAPWVADVMLEKVRANLARSIRRRWDGGSWPVLIERIRETSLFADLAEVHQAGIRFLLDHDDTLSADGWKALREWLNAVSSDRG